MEIRSFAEKDAGEVSALIAGALRTSDIGDYSSEYIENEVRALQATAILQRVTWTHFHVACDEGKIVGCGESGPYWCPEDESSLFTFFVLPKHQGKGIGRSIVQTLEQDKFFSRAGE